MTTAILIFLSSGLFLGWSLGANDAANVYGTAVGTRMIRFRTAALLCSVFVILGAVFSGSGAAHTLGKLGAVNAIPGAFVVALAAGLTVYWMTKAGLPVSTSQAIVGSIIGWNLFTGSLTDAKALTTIVTTWVVCPLLSAAIAASLYVGLTKALRRAKLHILFLDHYTRTALLLAGAFGSYSLGANNIANVMGVFIPASPFTPFQIADMWTVTSTMQLFFLGALAIAVGVYTYSGKVMMTVGRNLMPLNPVAAFVVVLSHSIVLFMFASKGLEHALASAGLPTIPLVPVSSSQAVIGAVVGISLLKKGRNLRLRVLGGIAAGWAATPVAAGAISFVALFFMANVFGQKVYIPVTFELTTPVIERLESAGFESERVGALAGVKFDSARQMVLALGDMEGDDSRLVAALAKYAEVYPLSVDEAQINALSHEIFTDEELEAVLAIKGARFRHKWQLEEALAKNSTVWKLLPNTTVNKLFNNDIKRKLGIIYASFSVKEGVERKHASADSNAPALPENSVAAEKDG